MSEGTQHGSQSAMPDHSGAAGHEPIVVGEVHHLDVVRDPCGAAADRRAEREDGVEIETADRLADALAAGETIRAGGLPVRVQKPGWVRFEVPGAAA